ncbi:MAG: hypothetical protein GX945_02415 [Lentisphaerae bacterium]|nr:hypothetical protein [Lentisphaerota bacterium]
MTKHLIMALLCCAVAVAQTDKTTEYPELLTQIEAGDDFAPKFPFQIQLGLPDNISNVQTWSGGPWQPAGSDGFLAAKGIHFVDGRSRRRRFLGTNICFGGCFPESKDDAEAVAAALARFGINSVRMHYVHHAFPPQRRYSSPDSFIEPVQLDRFDYLVHQLQKRGIYIYMQLNIARKFGAAAGFENADQLPWYNNGLDHFEPRMIALQKKFHRDFMTHVNPYSGRAYKDDPGIVTLEIANENSVVNAWYSSRYDLANLPEPYGSLFTGLWNDWLAKKYANSGAMKAAWQMANVQLGDEMIADGAMAGDIKNAEETAWGFQQDGGSVSTWEVLDAPAGDAGPARFARLKVDKIGFTPNIPQFYRSNLVVRKVQPYTLSFKLRLDKPAPLSVRLSQDHNPWHVAGFRTRITNADSVWQDYRYTFLANMDDDKVRLVFADFTPGVIDIADISLRPGACFTWPAGISLEQRSVPLPKDADLGLFPRCHEDFAAFLHDIENSYYQDLYSHLKNDIGVRQLVTGTQLQYGFSSVQARMDYCDNHSYWNHPIFPAKAWDGKHWYLNNTSLVNHLPALPGRTLANLANARIHGKPLTISEYDHPNSNFYSAEGNLILAANAAFQDWAGFYQFAWTHSREYWRSTIPPTFDMCSANAKLAHLPACYAMFVRGDVQAGPVSTAYVLPSRLSDEITAVARAKNAHVVGRAGNEDSMALALGFFSGQHVAECGPLHMPAGVRVVDDWQALSEKQRAMLDQKCIRNDTGELVWDFQQSDAGFFTVDTPNTKVFTGFVRGRRFEYKGLSIIPGKNRLDWFSLSLTNSTPPTGKAGAAEALAPGRYLLAATGLNHNSDAVVRDIGKTRIAVSEFYGGSNGKAPILAEGISAELILKGIVPARVQAFALDGYGERMQAVAIGAADDSALIRISPEYKTLWYELVIQ